MNARPGFTFCICPDFELSSLHADKMLAQPSSGAPAAAWERRVFRGEEPLSPAFWQCLAAASLFEAPRRVILRHAEALTADDWKQLSAVLARPISSTWLFLFLEVPFEKTGPKIPAHVQRLKCWRFALQNKWVWQSPGLTNATLKTFAQQLATARQLTFEPGALEALCARLPQDAAAARAEIEKLSLAAADGRITASLAACVGQEPALDIFAFIRGLQDNKQPHLVWRTVLSGDLAADGAVFGFIAMLLREAHVLWQLLFNEPVRLPPAVADSKKKLAKSLGVQGLAGIWDVAAIAERSIKSGECSPEQAMELLTAKLLVLFSPALEK